MNQRASLPTLSAAMLLTALLLSGCQTYHSQPLPAAPDLMRSPALTVPASELGLPGLKPHPFNPKKGLDETTVITLGVLNNPGLKAARLQAGVAKAQLLEAGLLPDPQVSGGLNQSTMHTGYAVGLSEDLQALITRGAAQAAARSHRRQVNLQILWMEWQVAARARELFIQAQTDGPLEHVLELERTLRAKSYHADEVAMRQGNATASRVSTDLAALADVDARQRQLQLNINRTRHELDLLLGFKPDVTLHLVGRDQSCGLSRKEFQAAVAALPRRRADLLALQAGYQSQEQRLREAILAQFPDLSAGVTQARSAEEGVSTVGLTVNLTLPIFNRNQGRIAIQRATRAWLYQTYQARLDQAVSQADQVWQAAAIMARQMRHLEKRLLLLKKDATAAKQSFQDGNMDFATYISVESNYLNARVAAIELHASLVKAQAALVILLAGPQGAG